MPDACALVSFIPTQNTVGRIHCYDCERRQVGGLLREIASSLALHREDLHSVTPIKHIQGHPGAMEDYQIIMESQFCT